MIILHRLNKSEIILNSNLIELIESTPDTLITLNNDRKYIVLEPATEVVEKIVEYQRRIRQLPKEN